MDLNVYMMNSYEHANCFLPITGKGLWSHCRIVKLGKIASRDRVHTSLSNRLFSHISFNDSI